MSRSNIKYTITLDVRYVNDIIFLILHTNKIKGICMKERDIYINILSFETPSLSMFPQYCLLSCPEFKIFLPTEIC